jgi:hypothetical protein
VSAVQVICTIETRDRAHIEDLYGALRAVHIEPKEFGH